MMRMFSMKRKQQTKDGFVPLVHPGTTDSDTSSFNSELSRADPAKVAQAASYNMNEYKSNDSEGDASIRKRSMRTMKEMLAVTEDVTGEASSSTPKNNESMETATTISETTSLSAHAREKPKQEKVRPVLITVKPNDTSTKIIKPKAIKPQYSPDILGRSDFDSSIRHPFFDRSLNDDSVVANSLYTNSSFVSDSQVGESEFTESIVDDSMVDSSYYSLSDDDYDIYSMTTDSVSDLGSYRRYRYRRRRRRKDADWDVSTDVPKAFKEVALALQAMMEDVSMCGSYMMKTTEDSVCADDRRKKSEDRWVDLRDKRRASKSRSKGRNRRRKSY